MCEQSVGPSVNDLLYSIISTSLHLLVTPFLGDGGTEPVDGSKLRCKEEVGDGTGDALFIIGLSSTEPGLNVSVSTVSSNRALTLRRVGGVVGGGGAVDFLTAFMASLKWMWSFATAIGGGFFSRSLPESEISTHLVSNN